MDEGVIINYIQNLGFPIFVCLYFMFRFEKILKANTDALIQLKNKIK